MSPPPRTRADLDLLLLAVSILAVGWTVQVTPDLGGISLFGWRLPDVCWSKVILDRDCYGCGITRSVVLSLRLDPRALDLHPIGPLFAFAVLAQLPYRAARLWRRRAPRQRHVPE